MINRIQHKKLFGFLSIVFFLSGISLTILLSLRPIPAIYYAVEFVLCSLIWGYIAFRYRIIDKALERCTQTDLILSVVLAVAFIPTHYQSLQQLIDIFFERDIHVPATIEPYLTFFLSNKILILTPVLAFAAISLCFIFIYVSGRIRSKIIGFFKGLLKYEKIFLITGCVLFAVTTVILYNQTNVFYQPEREDTGVIYWDIIYTTAPGVSVERNCYANPAAPENDIRQPFFGIFAMPFGLSAKLVSFLIPASHTFPICMNILQIMLLFISIVLLSRMLDVGKPTKIFFLLFAVVAFPFLLFAFNMEQYVFALFWTILLVYHSFVTKKTSEVLSVAAFGSISTSVILIPILWIINKEFRSMIQKGWRIIRLSLGLFICGGLMEIVYKTSLLIATYVGFLSDYGYIDKFRQFTHFIVSCIMAPCSRIINYSGHIAYHLCAPETVNILGMTILGITVLSGFLFRRRFIAKISLCWVGFAVSLIAILGWGTAENGTVLYSLYIYWAFIVLLTLLIDKLLSKTAILKYTLFGILLVALCIYNIMGMLEVIRFGIKYYPVL